MCHTNNGKVTSSNEKKSNNESLSRILPVVAATGSGIPSLLHWAAPQPHPAGFLSWNRYLCGRIKAITFADIIQGKVGKQGSCRSILHLESLSDEFGQRQCCCRGPIKPIHLWSSGFRSYKQHLIPPPTELVAVNEVGLNAYVWDSGSSWQLLNDDHLYNGSTPLFSSNSYFDRSRYRAYASSYNPWSGKLCIQSGNRWNYLYTCAGVCL